MIKWLTPYVAEFGVLPLNLGWTETHGIRPDGENVSWSTEGEYVGTRPVDNRIWVLNALVDGCRRYPELRQLLPERPSGAVDCLCCKHPLFAPGKMLCGVCGGVGWLPAQG